MASEPSISGLSRTTGRWRRVGPALGLGVLLLAGALYLNHRSAAWVPEAEAKVKAAQEEAAHRQLADLEARAKGQPTDAAVQLAFAQALADHGSFVGALVPAERAVA